MFAAKAMFQWFMEQLRKAEKRANAKCFAESTGRIQQHACIILEEGAYEEALQALDESIAMDRSLSKLQIREKYRQQLNQMAEMMLVAAAGIVFCGRKLYKSR